MILEVGVYSRHVYASSAGLLVGMGRKRDRAGMVRVDADGWHETIHHQRPCGTFLGQASQYIVAEQEQLELVRLVM